MSLHSLVRVRAFPLVVIFGAAVVVAVASPTLALAQTTGDGTGGCCLVGPPCGLGDLGTWLQQTVGTIVSNFLGSLVKTFGDAIASFINDVNFLTRTPENLSYNHQLVKQFAMATQVLADGLLAVVVLVGGFNVMLRPYMGATYAGAQEFLPRLLLGGILINAATWWCRLAIDANNAACGVFGAPTTTDVLVGVLHVAGDPLSGLVMVLVLVLVVMTILLIVQQLMRLALVDVLVV
jgi:hypothetical protein